MLRKFNIIFMKYIYLNFLKDPFTQKLFMPNVPILYSKVNIVGGGVTKGFSGHAIFFGRLPLGKPQKKFFF